MSISHWSFHCRNSLFARVAAPEILSTILVEAPWKLAQDRFGIQLRCVLRKKLGPRVLAWFRHSLA